MGIVTLIHACRAVPLEAIPDRHHEAQLLVGVSVNELREVDAVVGSCCS